MYRNDISEKNIGLSEGDKIYLHHVKFFSILFLKIFLGIEVIV